MRVSAAAARSWGDLNAIAGHPVRTPRSQPASATRLVISTNAVAVRSSGRVGRGAEFRTVRGCGHSGTDLPTMGRERADPALASATTVSQWSRSMTPGHRSAWLTVGGDEAASVQATLVQVTVRRLVVMPSLASSNVIRRANSLWSRRRVSIRATASGAAAVEWQ